MGGNNVKKHIRAIAIALAVSAALTWLCGSSLLKQADNAVSDALLQRPSVTDGEIVIVGIDQRAQDALGALPWPRSYIAEVISCLNADAETAPAVIGVDVIYAGYSADPDADAALVRAAAEGGNVVVASAAVFGSSITESTDSFCLDPMAVLAFDAPFEELAAVTKSGHINVMADQDGFIRHALHNIETPVGTIPSFSRVVYEQYAAYHGLELNPPPAVDENGFFYLPYTAEPGGYDDGISVLDVLEGTVDPAAFAGKIVLIGPYASGLQDEYHTSADHAAPMYGVELHANMIDAFRSGFLPRTVNRNLQLAVLFLCSAALILVLRNRKVKVITLIWLLLCVGSVLLCLLAYHCGYVLHVLWLPLAATVILVGSVADNYVRAAKEKRRITATFGRYVDPAVLKQLLQQGSAAEHLGGKLHNIAVLFVDIRGFTAMSEHMDPPTVVEVVNRCLTLTTECIMRYDGTLDKFVGDCTMAFWNAPLPQADPVYLACCAAMDMVEQSKSLMDELQEKYGHRISFGVGVHYGPAVVGNIGAPRRMDYTAIGDTVNTAARLEANAPGGSVLISRAVADELGERGHVTSLGGSIPLKGKVEGFEVLMLDSLAIS